MKVSEPAGALMEQCSYEQGHGNYVIQFFLYILLFMYLTICQFLFFL